MERANLFVVRPRRPSDDEAIVRLGHGAFARYSHAPDRSVAAMLSDPNAEIAVAQRGPHVIGFVIVSFDRLKTTFGPWKNPVIAHLDAIAVDPSAQRRGAGSALLNEALGLASDRGAIHITLRTAMSNTAAQTLFRSAGFCTTVNLGAFYRGGQPAIAMTKLLDL